MIYKYLDTKGITAIFTQTLLAKHVEEFNDPFECDSIHLYNDKPLDDHRLPTLFEGESIDPPPDICNAIKMSKMMHDKHKDGCAVICFSRDPLNILMWSHYAESHKGFVLGFDEEILLNSGNFSRNSLIEIQYSDKKPAFSNKSWLPGHTDIYNHFRNSISTKSRDWEYEKEVRLLTIGSKESIYNTNTYRVSYSPNSLKEIYLGAKMASMHKRLVTEYFVNNKFSPNISDVFLSEKEFKLETPSNDRPITV